jgi:hypothetical protein
MEKKKIDKIIEAFRHYRYLKEEGMVVSAIGPTNKTGPEIVNFDPVMKLMKRKRDGNLDYRMNSKYKKWVKSIDK